MTNPSDDVSRRSFLKATLAGVAVSLTKVPGMVEIEQKSQGINPVSGSQSDDLTRMSIREASDLIRAKKARPFCVGNVPRQQLHSYRFDKAFQRE